MAWLRKSKKKVGRVVRVKRPDGTIREYRYPAYKPRPDAAGDTVQALVDAWRKSQAWSDLAPASQAVYGIYLRELEKAGTAIVEKVTRRDLLDAQDAIARERGNGAANMFIRTASAMFGWAVDRGWIERSPVHRIPKRPGGSIPAWTAEQIAAALDGLPEHLRRVVILAAYTGQRRGDLCALTWAAYDGEALRLTQQKTGAELVIAAHPDLRRELNLWKISAVTLTILANSQGRPWDPQVLTTAFRRALRRLGLPEGLSVHGIRKTFAATLASRGASTHQIAAGTGHRTLGMLAHYTRSADQRRLNQDAISLLPDLSDTKITNLRKS